MTRPQMKTVEALATILSLTGAALVSCQRIEGFYLWLVANALWMWFAHVQGHRWMLVTFAVYWITAVIGIVVWSG